MSTLYYDDPPTKYREQIKNQIKKIPSSTKQYIKSSFPIFEWLPSYNLIWLSGDLTAAITVAVLVIPQSLAYAKIANLPPVFGLYTSFLGVLVYPLFGTSKDISIGVSAVMSLMVGQVLGKFTVAQQYLSGEWTMVDAAVNLSFFAGVIVLFLGLFRLGFLFRFICQPAIAGFMAGSGITIMINQFNKIFGIPNINTSEAPYLVFGKTLINIHHSTVDAAFGLTALLYLYIVKYLSQYLARRYPNRSRLWFFFGTTRSIVVLVFGTLICFMINRFGNFDTSPMTVIGTVPGGLAHVATPALKTDLVQFFLSDLPGIVVLLIMEHGAISSSLGSTLDYKVNMSQEMTAIGLSNVFGSFFCAYPGTGAFSRTAVMSKSGARTPLSSFFVGAIVIVSIYVFTPAFTYIPIAGLSAIIAHSVSDLISGPSAWRAYWEKDPTEAIIYTCAYVISLVTRIDIAVYVPVILSILVQLYRTSQPSYTILNQLDLLDQSKLYLPSQSNLKSHLTSPGLICFRPQENITFQNSAYLFERVLDEIKRTSRCAQPIPVKVGDRPWNNHQTDDRSDTPILKAIVLDLSGVHQMDYSGMASLIDTAVAAERYSGQAVRWYLVPGFSQAVRKSLLCAGFGQQRPNPKMPGRFLSDLRLEGHVRGIGSCQKQQGDEVSNQGPKDSILSLDDCSLTSQKLAKEGGPWCYCHVENPEDRAVAVKDRYPFFFLSVQDAVQAALSRLHEKVESEGSGSVSSEEEEIGGRA